MMMRNRPDLQGSKRPRHLMAALLCGLLVSVPVVQAEIPVTRGSSVLAAADTARQSSTPEWVYTLGEGETFTGMAKTLLKSNISPTRLLRHNDIATANSLQPGTKVRIPLDWLKRQPEPAKVNAVTGQAWLISGSQGMRRPVTEQSTIRVGDELITRTGTVNVELADGSHIRVAPDSRLVFNRMTQYGKAGMVDTRLRLNQGEIHTRVKPIIQEGSRFEIETPSAVAAVRGTAFTMQTSPGKTQLQVTEGEVAFGPPGQVRYIPAGYSASVDTSGHSPMTIRKLPPAPELNPLPETVTRLPAELSWQPNPADRHQLDIFDKDSGQWLLSETVANDNFNLQSLDNGGYEIHVAALDPRGMAGIPAIKTLDVDLKARPAQPQSPATGDKLPDDMPEFSWTFQGENEIGRVEIATDENFSNVVATSEWAPENTALPSRPLQPGQYYWRVVTEAGGNSVATSKPRTLVIDGSLPPVEIISVNYLDQQVRIFWQSVESANDYRLQLSEEPGFDNIIKEATVSDTTAALRLIPGRRYFVRLKALSEGPLASRWGPGRELYLE